MEFYRKGMEYLEKMLTDEWETVKAKALQGEDVDGVTVLTDFERGKIAAGRFTVDHYKDRIIKRLGKGHTWRTLNKYKKCMALPADKINCVAISIDWRRNVYGMQARAMVNIIHDSDRSDRFAGERTDGCGYDKSSSAVSYALSESDYMYKLLYEYVNKQMDLPKDKRRFSSGMGVFEYNGGDLKYLPRFEGGVGMGPMVRTIKLITGLTNETVNESKAYDFYVISK